MTYKQTIEYLFSSLPMFQRVGDIAIKKDLTNIRLLCTLLDQPHERFESIHIAGTNGKGSCSHMLASVFQAAGYKVGLYTSPHYVDFRERIRINGQMITEKGVIRFVEKYKDYWEKLQPSFFEITVAMAFDHFRNEKVDIAVIETGLGGRLDSTNIIHPRLSVITNIGFDHMNMLGNTLPAIASEKAGIIKPGVPVIIGEWKKETAPVFKKKAALENARIHFSSRHLTVRQIERGYQYQRFSVKTRSGIWYANLRTDLTGPYQIQNISIVLEAIWQWNKNYPSHKLSARAVRMGLSNVKLSTGMTARWLVLSRKPTIIADAAHNIDGMRAMLPELLRLPCDTRHFVLGFVSDKDIKKMLALFPKNSRYYWCAPDIPRRKPVSDTQTEAGELGLDGEAYSSVWNAYSAAVEHAGKSDIIFIGGSSYVVGDFLAQSKAFAKK